MPEFLRLLTWRSRYEPERSVPWYKICSARPNPRRGHSPSTRRLAYRRYNHWRNSVPDLDSTELFNERGRARSSGFGCANRDELKHGKSV